MLKFSHFGWGYLASNGSGEQTDLYEFYDLSSSIENESFKSNNVSEPCTFGLDAHADMYADATE